MSKLKVNKTLFCKKENSLAGFGDEVSSIRRSLDDSLIAYINSKGQLYFPKPIGLLECKIVINFIETEDLIEILQNRQNVSIRSNK